MQAVVDVVVVGCLLVGSLFALLAGLGLVRFPDVVSRLHAGTKPQVTGILLIISGAALRLAGTPAMWMLVLAGLLQFLTVPLSAHMVSRVAYRGRHMRRDLLVVDESGLPPGGGAADGSRAGEASEGPGQSS